MYIYIHSRGSRVGWGPVSSVVPISTTPLPPLWAPLPAAPPQSSKQQPRPLPSLPPSLSSSSRHKATATPQGSGLKGQATGDERDERRPASPPRLPPGGHTRDGDAAAAEALHKSAKDLSPSSPRVSASKFCLHPSVRPPSHFLWPVGGGCRSAYTRRRVLPDMVGRMERQTASSSASCSPSAAASSSACGGKKRPDILNMIRVRLNLLTLLLLRLSE